MRHQHVSNPAGLAVLAACLCAAGSAAQPPSLEPRVPVGRCASAAGTVLARGAPGRAWRPLGPKDRAFSRDLLLALPGARGVVESPGGVRLTLWGNLPDSADFPVL